MDVSSYIGGSWVAPDDTAKPILSAVTSAAVARVGRKSLDTQLLLSHARNEGGPALRELSFHQRASRLKALATKLNEHKSELTELSFHTGATRTDSKIDIDGGIGTVFVFASKGKREMPDAKVLCDGDVEKLSRHGSFVGQHVYTPKLGVSVQINAYNFPVWGMLEKLAPSLLAGVPVIVKPATVTSYVAQACFKLMLESEIFPPGSMQFIAGRTGDLLDRLDFQDTVSFTGSADTAFALQSNPLLLKHGVSFSAEQDSLNATVLGQDVGAGSDDFNVFVSEVVSEMSAKAGQKCTAIRRIMAPAALVPDVVDAVSEKLSNIKVGDPSLKDTDMGALVSLNQRRDVQEKLQTLSTECETVFGAGALEVNGADANEGAFMLPRLLHCTDPANALHVHSVEAFGPVATVMPYANTLEACTLLNKGGGSLVASVVTSDPIIACNMVTHSAAYHGRLYFNNFQSAKEATGHGSPLPHMTHGGPGRAGGGEELGGIRAVKHYMQRTSVQASPLNWLLQACLSGATKSQTECPSFRKTFPMICKLGKPLALAPRVINLEDIEHFAHFTGDTFYAHMDAVAAKANPFFPDRVAHGYLLLSFAAGLFVDPDPGPVLANTGLNALSFQKPVVAGDSLLVSLTVKRKTRRNDDYGEVRWHVELENQDGDQVASYELLTMNTY
ncbi:UNVERIFIED_CONTAM: hypothetical protein GTU68_032815 [Idotea baltica]|nr:hypothetical protein [Idotea baltica]